MPENTRTARSAATTSGRIADAAESLETPQRQSFTPRERAITLTGVMIVLLLASLDQTIVSTAMPRIVAELAGLELYAGVTTAYMLASTVMVPVYGKLNDIFGRKPVLVAGILIFLIGSALCGMAGEFGPLPLLGGGMSQLIAFRAVQGLGGAALFTSAFAIVADLYSPRERAKLGGLFGTAPAVATLLGPLVGGFFADLSPTTLLGLQIDGWRWAFYVNVPTGLLALFMITAKMPVLTNRVPGRIDLIGAALIAGTFVPFLLALTWGGRDYPWDSALILGLLAVSAIGLASFLLAEAVSPNPILSLNLFRNRVFTTANAASFLTSMVYIGSVNFIPLYMQLGQGVAPTVSGLAMVPITLGTVCASTISGHLASRTGHYKTILVVGSVLIAVGLFLLVQTGPETTALDMAWRGLVIGIGLGPSLSLFDLAVQNALPREQVGVSISASQFFRRIGGTVGVAVFGAVLTQRLSGGQTAHGEKILALTDLQEMALSAAGSQSAEIQLAISHALSGVLYFGVAIAVAALLMTLLVPSRPLDRH